MTRRASLPGVEELFRSSRDRQPESEVPPPAAAVEQPAEEPEPGPPVPLSTSLHVAEEPAVAPPPVVDKSPSREVVEEPDLHVASSSEGKRPRHDEKVTFYCTASDLTRIERARLALRAEHRLASDRGRIVRAALAEILDDFEARGADSALVRHLQGQARQPPGSQ